MQKTARIHHNIMLAATCRLTQIPVIIQSRDFVLWKENIMREGTECLRTILSQDPFIEARTTARESLAIKRFSDLCNTFGDHDEEIANAILVDEKNKKHFLMLAAGCMASLGYAGECEKRMQREHWDLRNKAATEYCLKHL